MSVYLFFKNMRMFLFAGVNILMAKHKSLKPETNPPKRKKLSSITSEVHVEEMMDATVKKKKMEVEVSSAASCACSSFK